MSRMFKEKKNNDSTKHKNDSSRKWPSAWTEHFQKKKKNTMIHPEKKVSFSHNYENIDQNNFAS